MSNMLASLTRCNIRGDGGIALANGIVESQVVYIEYVCLAL